MKFIEKLQGLLKKEPDITNGMSWEGFLDFRILPIFEQEFEDRPLLWKQLFLQMAKSGGRASALGSMIGSLWSHSYFMKTDEILSETAEQTIQEFKKSRPDYSDIYYDENKQSLINKRKERVRNAFGADIETIHETADGSYRNWCANKHQEIYQNLTQEQKDEINLAMANARAKMVEADRMGLKNTAGGVLSRHKSILEGGLEIDADLHQQMLVESLILHLEKNSQGENTLITTSGNNLRDLNVFELNSITRGKVREFMDENAYFRKSELNWNSKVDWSMFMMNPREYIQQVKSGNIALSNNDEFIRLVEQSAIKGLSTDNTQLALPKKDKDSTD